MKKENLERVEESAAPKRKRNNYFSKPRRSVNMWVIYVKRTGEKLYYPVTDVHGAAFAYGSKRSAAGDLYNTRKYIGQAYLQRVGPIC
jgi:hypothetical protein